MEKVCKNCKFWKNTHPEYADFRQCDKMETHYPDRGDVAFIALDAADDTGLWAKLYTKETFFCASFKPLEDENKSIISPPSILTSTRNESTGCKAD